MEMMQKNKRYNLVFSDDLEKKLKELNPKLEDNPTITVKERDIWRAGLSRRHILYETMTGVLDNSGELIYFSFFLDGEISIYFEIRGPVVVAQKDRDIWWSMIQAVPVAEETKGANTAPLGQYAPVGPVGQVGQSRTSRTSRDVLK